MRIKRTRKATAAALAGALAACCVPAGALAAVQTQSCSNDTDSVAVQEVSDSFDSQVGLSSTRWAEVPPIATAWKNLNGSGSTASSLASFRRLFQAVHAYGSQLLEPYENSAPVLLENGSHYRMDADVLTNAMEELSAARAAMKENTSTAYYDQSRAIIGVVNAALCSVEAAPDADQLKLIWDGWALEQVVDEANKTVKLPKNAKATDRASNITVAASLSQSGAEATFSKENGSSKISVSKSGRCILKKGTKKGTYTVQVHVAYSNSTTKTTTVTFTVR